MNAVDANVLLYSLDSSEPVKQAIAQTSLAPSADFLGCHFPAVASAVRSHRTTENLDRKEKDHGLHRHELHSKLSQYFSDQDSATRRL